MSLAPVNAIPPAGTLMGLQGAPVAAAAAVGPAPAVHRPSGFAALIEQGIEAVDTKAKAADQAVRAFVLDDSIPVHQVSYALGQAQLSLELMLQIRGRMVEGYQQLMNMQL